MTPSLKPYPEYKDSGVPWLGKVPKHWDCGRLKSLTNNIVDATDQKQDDETYVELQNIESWTGRLKLSGSAEFTGQVKRFRSGDILFGKLRPYLAKVTRPNVAGVCVGELLVLRCVAKHIAPSYLELVLRSSRFIDYVNSSTYGAKMPRAEWQFIGTSRVPIPPEDEQQSIARFIRAQSSKLRRFIRNKRRMIALLREQKQAIINRAVTRGLDHNVPLKPSGIPWLGDIPEHWEVCRLRHVVSSVTSGSRGWSSFAADEGPLFLRIANLSRLSLSLRFDDIVRLKLPQTSEASRTRVQPGDVLLSITAYIGSVGVVPQDFEEAYVSQHVARCPLRDASHNPRWIGYVILSQVGQVYGQLSLYGGTKDGLSLDDVKNYPMLLPPRRDQDRIIHAVERHISVLDTAIARAEREIELMNEYRTRLIADVVTGKVDVRDVPVEEIPEDDTLDEVFSDEKELEDQAEGLDTADEEVANEC